MQSWPHLVNSTLPGDRVWTAVIMDGCLMAALATLSPYPEVSAVVVCWVSAPCTATETKQASQIQK